MFPAALRVSELQLKIISMNGVTDVLRGERKQNASVAALLNGCEACEAWLVTDVSPKAEGESLFTFQV